MEVLVIGGTGTVGSQAVRKLVEKGASVRVMTRTAKKAAGLPRGAAAVVGDMENPSTLPEAFRGAATSPCLTWRPPAA